MLLLMSSTMTTESEVSPLCTPMAESHPTAAAIAEHLPLVHRVVAQFVRRLPRSVQREDLVAAGTIGLFHALRSSAHTCPEMFASYARIRVRGAIVDELRRHDWSPRRRKEAEPPRLTLVPSGASGTNANASETATAPAARPARVRAQVSVIGFDDLPPHGADLASDFASPLDDVVERRERDALHTAIGALPAREREIIQMRYFQGLPSKTIAERLGLSEARISQLHARATSRLRDLLSSSDAPEVKLAA